MQKKTTSIRLDTHLNGYLAPSDRKEPYGVGHSLGLPSMLTIEVNRKMEKCGAYNTLATKTLQTFYTHWARLGVKGHFTKMGTDTPLDREMCFWLDAHKIVEDDLTRFFGAKPDSGEVVAMSSSAGIVSLVSPSMALSRGKVAWVGQPNTQLSAAYAFSLGREILTIDSIETLLDTADLDIAIVHIRVDPTWKWSSSDMANTQNDILEIFGCHVCFDLSDIPRGISLALHEDEVNYAIAGQSVFNTQMGSMGQLYIREGSKVDTSQIFRGWFSVKAGPRFDDLHDGTRSGNYDQLALGRPLSNPSVRQMLLLAASYVNDSSIDTRSELSAQAKLSARLQDAFTTYFSAPGYTYFPASLTESLINALRLFNCTRDVGGRTKTAVFGHAFNSDVYAIESVIGTGNTLYIPIKKGTDYCDTKQVIDYLKDKADVLDKVVLEDPSYLHLNRLDMTRIFDIAHSLGIIVIAQKAHSFANGAQSAAYSHATIWCEYKHGRCGPGSGGGMMACPPKLIGAALQHRVDSDDSKSPPFDLEALTSRYTHLQNAMLPALWDGALAEQMTLHLIRHKDSLSSRLSKMLHRFYDAFGKSSLLTSHLRIVTRLVDASSAITVEVLTLEGSKLTDFLAGVESKNIGDKRGGNCFRVDFDPLYCTDAKPRSVIDGLTELLS